MTEVYNFVKVGCIMEGGCLGDHDRVQFKFGCLGDHDRVYCGRWLSW